MKKNKIKWHYNYRNVLRFWVFFITMIVSLPIVMCAFMLIVNVKDWSDIKFWLISGFIFGIFAFITNALRQDLIKHPMQSIYKKRRKPAKKEKIYSILIMTLMLVSTFYNFAEMDSVSTISDDIYTSTLRSPDNTTELFESPEITYPEILDVSKSIQATDWVEGESVHVKYDLPNAYVSNNFETSPTYGTEYDYPTLQVIAMGSLDSAHANGGAAWQVGAVDDSAVETPEYAGAAVLFHIPALTSGTLYWEFALSIEGSPGVVEFPIGTSTSIGISGTTSMAESAISSEGYLEFFISFAAWHRTSPGTDTECFIQCYRTSGSGSSNVIYYSSLQTHTKTQIQYVRMHVDQFYFVRDDIETDIRSEYRQTDYSTIEHKLEIENFEYGTQIDISKPTHWNLSYITPTAITTLSVNDIQVTNTIPVTYEIGFHSTTNQISAVFDKTSNYMNDIGFEGSWSNDWANTSSYEWSINLTSSKVFSGAYALNLTSASSITTYCSLDSYLYPAKCLITFVYYRTTSDPIYFYWWDNDQWNSEALLTITDRWIKHTGQYNITGDTGGYNIAFATAETDQVIYIDDFKSWGANGQVRTTGYANGLMQTGMFAILRNIDLYDNPVVPYHPINVKLIDRSSDGIILSYNTFTDENGRTQVSYVLPSVNQMDNMEYTYRVTSLLTNEYVDSYFTPIRVEYNDYFMIENYTYYGIGGIDFTENWDDRATYTNANDNQSSGVNMIRPTGTVSDFRIKFHNINDINANYYEFVSLKLKTNVSDLSVSLYNQSGQYIGTLANLPLSTGELDWTTVTWNLTEVSTWSGIQGGFELRFDEIGGDGNVEVDNFVWIDQIHLYYYDEPWLIDTATYGYLTTVYNEFVYYIVLDGIAQEYVFDLDPFLYDLTEGNHEIIITPFLDLSRRHLCYIPGETVILQYSVAETGVMKIIYHDQSGYIIDFDQFKTYIDGVRLYEQYVYFLNTSMSFNLTVTDIFDNMLYQDTTETFEQFKEIQLTLHSVKVQNVQDNPIWFRIQRGSKYYSEWIFSFEVSEFKLEEADYTIFVYYSDVASNFSVATNGTYVSYAYYVDTDTAIRVTGTSIEDVFNNVVSLAQNLDDVNASLSNQIISVNISIANVNTSIANQVVNVEINIGNINSSLGNQLISLSSDIANVNTTLYSQTVTLLSNLANVNTTIYDQTIQLLSDIANVNSTIYTQTLSILSDIANLDSDIVSQTVTLLSDIENVNSTIYTQTLSIISDLANVNTTIYSQTIQVLSDIQNANATLYAQDILILNSLMNTNSTLYSQTISILEDLAQLSGIYRVHFSVIDSARIGLPWETVLLTVNDTRQFDQDIYLSNNTIFNATAYDWFDVELWSNNYTITEKTEVNISIDLYNVIFYNNGSYTAYVEVWRNNKLGVNVSIPEGQSLSIRLTSGLYEYRVYYFEENEQETDKADPGIYSYGRRLIQTGNFRVSAAFPLKIDSSTPVIKQPLIAQVISELTLVWLIMALLTGIVGLTAGYFVTNFFIRRSIGRIAKDPSYVKPKDRDDYATKLYKKFKKTEQEEDEKKKLW